MKFTPSSTARRRAVFASSRSAGHPHTPSPVIRMAPYPSRLTVRSPPTSIVPAAAAVGVAILFAPLVDSGTLRRRPAESADRLDGCLHRLLDVLVRRRVTEREPHV